LIDPSLKENETMEVLKREGSILKYRVTSLWLTYIGEKRTTFALANGIKVRCYWELFGEHVRNLGTLCFDPHPSAPLSQYFF